MNEEALAQDYLIGYLEADTELMGTANAVTLGVRWARLPRPFVKVDRLGSSDLYTVDLHRVWDDLTFLVRAVHHWEGSGAPDWTTVNTLAHRSTPCCTTTRNTPPTSRSTAGARSRLRMRWWRAASSGYTAAGSTGSVPARSL